MIPAKEAHDLTIKKINESLEKELEFIQKRINEEINNREFFFTEDGVISFEAKHCLEELGYEVSLNNYLNDSTYTISWEN